jgi:hypothetical protein
MIDELKKGEPLESPDQNLVVWRGFGTFKLPFEEAHAGLVPTNIYCTL